MRAPLLLLLVFCLSRCLPVVLADEVRSTRQLPHTSSITSQRLEDISPRACALQARTWNALWSSLKNYTLSNPKATSRSWNPEALSDMHSRMLQRLADLYQQRANQTATFDGSSGLAALANLTTTAALTRSFFSGSGANSSLPPFDLAAFNFTALMGGTSDVSSLLQRLKDDISKLDYNQLAKLAMLQGWALASMYSVYSMSNSKRSLPSSLIRRELPLDHTVQVTGETLVRTLVGVGQPVGSHEGISLVLATCQHVWLGLP